MTYKTTNIFCIIASTGSEQELYLNHILSDNQFIKSTKLSRLIYNTTKPKDKYTPSFEKYNYVTLDQYKEIPSSLIIDFRSYYTIPYDTVYYFTLTKDIEDKDNLICITCPYQYENYKRWISLENLKNPEHDKYRIYAIFINSKLKDRINNRLSKSEMNEDINLLEFCRRVLQDHAEFKDAQVRIPELNDPLDCDNVCYINSKSTNSDFKKNIEQIKEFILDKVKKH